MDLFTEKYKIEFTTLIYDKADLGCYLFSGSVLSRINICEIPDYIKSEKNEKITGFTTVIKPAHPLKYSYTPVRIQPFYVKKFNLVYTSGPPNNINRIVSVEPLATVHYTVKYELLFAEEYILKKIAKKVSSDNKREIKICPVTSFTFGKNDDDLLETSPFICLDEFEEKEMGMFFIKDSFINPGFLYRWV